MRARPVKAFSAGRRGGSDEFRKVFDFFEKNALQARSRSLICAPHDRHIAQLVRAPP
ncbi:hypothetical protein EMIT047CA2_90297 [Pseudomonas soli]